MKKVPLNTSIKIQIPAELLIVEKSLESEMDIAKGSHIYCGMCGNTIGRVNEKITLPVAYSKLLSVMTGLKCEAIKQQSNTCLYHQPCGKFLFTEKVSWVFIGLERYLREMAGVLEKRKDIN